MTEGISLYISLGMMNLHITEVREDFEEFLKAVTMDSIADLVLDPMLGLSVDNRMFYNGEEEYLVFNINKNYVLDLLVNIPHIEETIYNNNFGGVFRPIRDLIRYFSEKIGTTRKGNILTLSVEPKLVTPSILIINLKGEVK